MNGQHSDPATNAALHSMMPPLALDADELRLGVSDALAMTAIDEVIEVYVGWPFDPVNVVSRYRNGAGETWTTVSLLLRERVTVAIKPLTDVGWRMDGSPVATIRWDTTQESNGQHYDGCWVRMRTRGA